MDAWWWLVPLGVGLVIGALGVWLVTGSRRVSDAARHAALVAQVDAARAERDAARERVREVWSDRDAMATEFRLLTHEALAEQGRHTSEGEALRLRATEQLLRPVHASLERFNQRLADVERQRAVLTTDLAAHVASVRATGEELRRETAALASALRKPQVRGTWGELQLRRVAEIAGMVQHCDFEVQATTQSADGRVIRPDMKVTLAEGKFIYVDSKVPLSAFLDAHEAADDARAGHLARFVGHVRTHVDQLGGKAYYRADTRTPEFVVMFLPSEALAAEALALAPDLHEYAASRNVVLATPSTLIAMLKAVAYGWRQSALAASAAEVFALGRELYERLATLGGHVDKLGRSLTATVRAYNATLGSLETRVLVTGRRLHGLGLTDADLASPSPVDEVARPVTAPEWAATLGGPPATEHQPLPEAGDLVRPQPSLDDLLDSEPGADRAGWAGAHDIAAS